jgi:hypothetical protein
MSYGINPFKDEVLCDVSPLELCDIILGQPYTSKFHAIYESQPYSIIITLVSQFYRVPEVALITATSFISKKMS